MFPNEARLRNLTWVLVDLVPLLSRSPADASDHPNSYSAPLYIDMKKRVLVQDSDEPDPETGELAWIEEREDGAEEGQDEDKIYIGKVRCSSTSRS